MEQKYISNMKTNENLTLIQRYWDEEKTKPKEQYHVDQFGQKQGEYKFWFENGQPLEIDNFKDGIYHGKFQEWWSDGRRSYIDTNHFKKREHGTEIKFKYENKRKINFDSGILG